MTRPGGGLPTVGAAPRFLSCVISLVELQMLLLAETFTAARAAEPLVGRLLCRSAQVERRGLTAVGEKLRLQGEAGVADDACEQVEPCVDGHVSGQGASSGELLGAE